MNLQPSASTITRPVNAIVVNKAQTQSRTSSTVGTELSPECDTATKLSRYLTIYIDILEAANNEDFSTLSLQVSHFKRMLTSQLAENFRKLLLIQKMGGENVDNQNDVLRFHNDMVAIGGKILPILNRHDSQSLNKNSMPGLLNDLTEIGDVLLATAV